MRAGFALVAWPIRYGDIGVTTGSGSGEFALPLKPHSLDEL